MGVCTCVFVCVHACQFVAVALLFIMGSPSRKRMQSWSASKAVKSTRLHHCAKTEYYYIFFVNSYILVYSSKSTCQCAVPLKAWI